MTVLKKAEQFRNGSDAEHFCSFLWAALQVTDGVAVQGTWKYSSVKG